MTPRPRARLRVIFAPEAPVAVVLRRGPAKWVQMWRWDTANDHFEAGQWIQGSVHRASTLSPDGRYLIAQIMREDQHTTLCRPPFFSALAYLPGSLCVSDAHFLRDGSVVGHFGEIRAPGCPLRFVERDATRAGRVDNRVIDEGKGPTSGLDQQGRTIELRDGRLGVLSKGETRWLKDFDPYEPENVPPPGWALEW